MDNIWEYLFNLATKLDEAGKTACANSVDGLIKKKSAVKVAQYVGAIGYVLKQNRAMCNCIRQKRVSSTGSMQEVIFDCLKEYQDGQSYGQNEWTEKYASVVKASPDHFSDAHLYLIAEIANHNQIEDHIEEVEKTASLLRESGNPDAFLDTLLEDLNNFGTILSGDKNARPFKLAAPRSNRGFWSRLFNPSSVGINPLSWMKGRRERGEDKDTMLEMDNVLENIMSITTRAQQIRTGIYRLQNQVYGYLSGSGQDLSQTHQPQQEKSNVVQTVLQKIKELDDTNWNKSVLAIQQMQHLLTETPPVNDYNAKSLGLAKDLCDNMARSIDEVYKNIQAIQTNMQNLRQRAPVKGREFGDSGSGMASPAEEFGALEQVLNKLYQNPFDEKAHYYAQRMHSRLDDRLRSIKTSPDTSTDEWLKSNNKPVAPGISVPENVPTNTPSAPQNTTVNTPVNRPTNQAPAAAEMSDNAVQQSVNDLMEVEIPGLENPQAKAEALLYLLSHLGNVIQMDPNTKNSINKIRSSLDLLMNKPAVATPNATPAAPGQSAPTNVPVQDQDDEDDFSDAFNRGAFTITRYDLIKIADVLDKTDMSVADVVDEYIKEHKDEFIVLPKIPEKSEIIKDTVV